MLKWLLKLPRCIAVVLITQSFTLVHLLLFKLIFIIHSDSITVQTDRQRRLFIWLLTAKENALSDGLDASATQLLLVVIAMSRFI